MEVIDARELKARLDRREPFKLVMFMDAPAFARLHIPGSIQCDDARKAMTTFDKNEPIVGYCSSDDCVLSRRACQTLFENGFTHIVHFEGGVWAWEQAGFPLEGTEAR